MKKNLAILFLFVLVSLNLFSQSKPVEETILAGNEYYKQQQFAKATVEYNKAVETDPSNTTAKFNQANALYKQDKKVEAVQVFTALSASATDKELNSKAYYNKGVIL
ncbi:MAG: tetratricopeptide repeat protein, partial [Ferruginibacter sp.]|nr:tetratricopeptide repeat protein [Chitinophagaceae bacterium]